MASYSIGERGADVLDTILRLQALCLDCLGEALLYNIEAFGDDRYGLAKLDLLRLFDISK